MLSNRDKFEHSFDLREILDDEEIGYSENNTHFFLKECPICGKIDKFNIDKKTKLWVCWSCVQTDNFMDNKEGRGNLWTLLLTLGYEESQVRKIYKGQKFFSYTGDQQIPDFDFKMDGQADEESTNKTIQGFQIPQWLIPLDRSSDQIRNFTIVYQYLWDRHVRTKWQYTNFDLRYDHHRQRVVFPAYTKEGICVGTQSRDITERCKTNHPKCPTDGCSLRFKYYFKGEERNPIYCPECDAKLEEAFYPKSLNSRNFPKTEFFFNEQNLDWEKPVVLVEGPFDSINVSNSAAFLGKVLSDTQLQILFNNIKAPLVLYLDGDQAGDFSAQKIYQDIRPFFDIKIVYSKDGEDPGMYSPEYNQMRVDQACSALEWFERKQLMIL